MYVSSPLMSKLRDSLCSRAMICSQSVREQTAVWALGVVASGFYLGLKIFEDSD